MSKQPRLRKKLSHDTSVEGKDTPKWVFVPDWTRETDAGVAWSALIRSGDVNVCRVGNDGVGGDNHYQVISPELMDWLAVDAAKAYPVGFSMALDGFVADLWRASLEVQVNGRDAAAQMGF